MADQNALIWLRHGWNITGDIRRGLGNATVVVGAAVVGVICVTIAPAVIQEDLVATTILGIDGVICVYGIYQFGRATGRHVASAYRQVKRGPRPEPR